MSYKPHRRADDSRIANLERDVADLKVQLVENTEVTKQVRDILATFRITGLVAKWVAAIGAGFAAFWHGVQYVRAHF